MKLPPSPTRVKVARAIAVCADLLQIGLFPLFSEGFVSVLNDGLDVAVCVALTALVGWHFAFLPGFLMEIVPIVDLAPTWTIAVLIATRRQTTVSTGEPAGAGPTVDVEANVSPAGPEAPPKLVADDGPAKAREPRS